MLIKTKNVLELNFKISELEERISYLEDENKKFHNQLKKIIKLKQSQYKHKPYCQLKDRK
jgi:uncharacterized small protein (DUF1192 family)